MKLVQVLDISGSMGPNMKFVVSSALAAVDLLPEGSTLRIIVFDHYAQCIVPEITMKTSNKEALKDLIKGSIKNRNGGTDIQSALSQALIGQDQSIMFVTDGLANSGSLTTSEDLLYLARRMPDYCSNTVHCLGLQMHESDGINSSLLKDLALDTNGCFKIAKEAEAIACFLGDVMASHCMTVRRNCVTDLPGYDLITAVGINGYTVRADRPTTLVFKKQGPGEATESEATNDASNDATNDKPEASDEPTEPTEPEPQAALILNAYTSYVITTMHHGPYKANQLLAYLKTVKHASELRIQLEACMADGFHDNAKLSEALYNMSTSSSGDSQQIIDFRYMAHMSSQSQDL
jgi:hypothetical protein